MKKSERKFCVRIEYITKTMNDMECERAVVAFNDEELTEYCKRLALAKDVKVLSVKHLNGDDII